MEKKEKYLIIGTFIIASFYLFYNIKENIDYGKIKNEICSELEKRTKYECDEEIFKKGEYYSIYK